MSVQLNRFPDLARSIRKSTDRSRANRVAVDRATEIGNAALHRMIELSPRSVPGITFFTTGHDHTSIVDGWVGPMVREQQDGASVYIENTSEHISVQRTGTNEKGYIIPLGRRVGRSGPHEGSRNTLKFWLPTTNPVQKPKYNVPGFVRMRLVRHPGVEPHGGRDFVVRALDSAKPEIDLARRRMLEEIVYPLHRFFR